MRGKLGEGISFVSVTPELPRSITGYACRRDDVRTVVRSLMKMASELR